MVLEMTVAVAETVAAIGFGLSLFSYAAAETIIPAAKKNSDYSYNYNRRIIWE
jgi:hypothetical protein